MADDVLEDSGIDEELEVLKSIYIEELDLILSKRGWPEVISLQLHPSTGDEIEKKYVCITLELQPPHQYPHEIPVISIKNPRGIGEEEVDRLQKSLVTLARELQGGPMLYDLIELAKERLTEGNIPHCPCTICYEHFHEGDDFTKTACYHYFHSQCLSRYIKHVLENLHQESQARPSHQRGEENQTKVPCPVCREDIECSEDLLSGEVATEEQSLTFDPSAELRRWQEEMSRMLRRQREKGGVIDIERERNKFLVTQDDVVEITKGHGMEPSTKGHEMDSSTQGHGIESSTKGHETSSPTKGHARNLAGKETGKSAKSEVQRKPKIPPKETAFKASKIKERLGELEREVGRRWTGFSEEFENLNRRGAPLGSKKEGQRAENRYKNRVKHLVPYDSSRVILRDGDPEVKGSDYICASYIQIGNETNEKAGDQLIATQGCLTETVGDFWRMVWQERSQVIVMATKAVEDDRVKVACYWCEEGEERHLQGEYYRFRVLGKSLSQHRDYILREMEVSKLSEDNQEEGTRLVYQFNFTAWPDFGVPKNPESVIKFLSTVNKKQEELAAPGPMVIHCSAGIGRTGTLVVLEKLLHQLKQEGLDCDLDIQKTVLKVRSQRPGMVQTESQYKFVYRALLCYLNSQPGFIADQVKNEMPSGEERFSPKDRRGHGRVKQHSWREKDERYFSKEERKKQNTGNPSEKSQSAEPKTDSSTKEHSDEKTVRNSPERRGFGKPQSSKGMEKSEQSDEKTVRNSQERRGFGKPQSSKGMEKSEHSDEKTVRNSQERRGFGKPQSSKVAEKSQTNSNSAVRTDHLESQSVPGGKSHPERPRQGFGRPGSGKGRGADAEQPGSGKQISPRGQRNEDGRTQASPRGQRKREEDRSISANTRRSKGFRRPERNDHAEKEGNPRRDGERNISKGQREERSKSGRGNPGGNVADRITDSDKPKTSAGDGNEVRTNSDQRPRSDDRLHQGSDHNNIDRSGPSTNTAAGNTETGDDSDRPRHTEGKKPRVPPGFSVSGPPPGFGDPIRPPPGFTDIS